MSANRDDGSYRLSLDNLQGSCNEGISHVGGALYVVAFLGVIALPFGLFRVVPFGQAILWMYAIANAFGFLAVAWDEANARANRWRIHESMLHLLEGLGGFFGSFLAQQVFRYQTRRMDYQVVFWTIVAIHIGFWAFWFTYGAAWLVPILDNPGLDQNPAAAATPTVGSVEEELTKKSRHFIDDVVAWGRAGWPFWLPWTVLLPVPIVAAVYERVWLNRFREKKQEELARRSRPSQAELGEWRTAYRRRHLLGLGIPLGKAVLFLLFLGLLAGTVFFSIWVFNVFQFSRMSLVLGTVVLLAGLPLIAMFYHAVREKLDLLHLVRLMAVGREDVSRMVGVQVRMEEATEIARDYNRKVPGQRIKAVTSIICWPSCSLVFIAWQLHASGAVDVVSLLRNWGVQGTLMLYCVMSVCAFVRMCGDKSAARARGNARMSSPPRRVSEKELHWLEMLGGFLGSLIAQHHIRHKTEKFDYRYVFWTIVAFHALAWVVLLSSLDRIPPPGEW